jgi:hypothetical protein
MIVSGAAPPMVDALRRCTSRPAFCRFVFGPFHYCTFCERATPDAPETIYYQRRFTAGRYRTICGGSRGSASPPMLPVLTFCERATPDAPETIYDQRRFTGGRYRTICGGSRGSASLPMLPVLTFCERFAG